MYKYTHPLTIVYWAFFFVSVLAVGGCVVFFAVDIVLTLLGIVK